MNKMTYIGRGVVRKENGGIVKQFEDLEKGQVHEATWNFLIKKEDLVNTDSDIVKMGKAKKAIESKKKVAEKGKSGADKKVPEKSGANR